MIGRGGLFMAGRTETRIAGDTGLTAYRADIDGLRALAVTLVVLFHAGFQPHGGFIGVDVFFVISGYLISGIILEEARRGTFTVAGFYDRRVRRIVPALTVLLIAGLVAGALILTPAAFAVLGKSAAFASVGLANFFFFQNTGYFDGAAQTMPLLHIWSLAVEEQFYLVWPLLLAGAVRLSRRWPAAVGAVIALVIALSLTLALIKVGQGAKSAFYQPFGRAWELAAGGAVFLAQDRLRALPRAAMDLLKIAGLAAILVPAFLLTPLSSFPGANAIAPVAGAALLLLPSAAPTLASRLLAFWPLPAIGKISYSLYLWHWPVLVFALYYRNGEPLTSVRAAGLIAVSVGLAWLSWRFVEQPFRRARVRPRIVLLSGLAAGVAVAGAGLAVDLSGGIPSRVSPALAAMGSANDMWAWQCREHVTLAGQRRCVVGADWATAGTRAILWGDSHAEHLAPLLDVAGKQVGVSIATIRSCSAVVSEHGLKRSGVGPLDICNASYAAVSAQLKASPDIKLVILGADWNLMVSALYRNPGDPLSPEAGLALLPGELARVADDLAGPGRGFMVVGDVPRWQIDPLTCLAAQDGSLLRAPCDRELGRMRRADMYLPEVQDAVTTLFRSLQGQRRDTVVVVPGDALCDAQGCMSREKGEFLYMDGDHFRRDMTPEARAALTERLGLAAALRAAVAGAAAGPAGPPPVP